MNKSQAIKLLETEGWTKADAGRALELINFKTDPDELAIRRTISSFAGSELIKRQRLQAAQKSIVTKQNKEIERKDKEYANKIERYNNIQLSGGSTRKCLCTCWLADIVGIYCIRGRATNTFAVCKGCKKFYYFWP